VNEIITEGDLIPVEIAGQSIGDAVVTEITDDWIEVAFYGFTKRLGTKALDYLDSRRQIDSWNL